MAACPNCGAEIEFVAYNVRYVEAVANMSCIHDAHDSWDWETYATCVSCNYMFDDDFLDELFEEE